MHDPIRPDLDRATLEHAITALEKRLEAVATYGAGGCPTCHDAELRVAIAFLRRLVSPEIAGRGADALALHGARKGSRSR